MNRSLKRFLRRLLLVAAIAGAAAGYAWWAKPWEPKALTVTIETVTAGPAREVLAVNGRIVPKDEVDLGAPVSGQVLEVLVKEGDSVTRGQILARLDDTIARAAMDQAQASLEYARIESQAAKAAFDRANALTGTVSAQSLDSARFSSEAAAARVRQLTAALEQSERQLALYAIASPIDGTVLTVNAELGQVVGTSSVLFTVGDLSAPLVETDVDEVYGARMTPGLAARVAPVGSQEVEAATLSFVAPTVNRDTGGRTLRLSFDTPPAIMLPRGLTMSVNIVVETFEAAITAPRAAIQDLDGAPFVLLDDGGTARKVPVAVRHWPADRLVVTDGLAPGDRLITNPQDIGPGDLVTAETRV
jgi:RND family efflux transporter MFP subunit